MDTKSLSGKYHVVTEPSPGVCLLVMNRPPVNAFNDDMWLELQHILQRVSRDASVRVVVYASSLDKLYTAGLDLTDSTLAAGGDLDPARKAIGLHRHVIDFQAAISSLANCTQPVIAALNGICMGLAIDIASSCDIRLASSDAVFSIAEVNVGLAADIGTLQRFPKIIGNDSLARELALTARKFGAGEAKEIGFVSNVVQGGRKEVIAAAVDLAKVIAEKSPIAVMSTKHLLDHARDHTVQEGLDYTAAWNMSMLQSSDTVNAMKAALSKQKAKFEPLLPLPKKRDSKL